jgi:hypothetical protein
MGLSTQIQAAVKGMAQLASSSNKIFNDAVAKINTPTPSYTADDLTHDVTQIGLQALLLWLKFWMPVGDPVLPTAVVSVQHTKIRGKSPTGFVSVAEPIDPAATISVTPLAFVGWSQVPAAKDASQIAPLSATAAPQASDPLRQDLVVTLTVPNSAPVPEQGLYQGFVMVGTGAGTHPVAIVLVQAT